MLAASASSAELFSLIARKKKCDWNTSSLRSAAEVLLKAVFIRNNFM